MAIVGVLATDQGIKDLNRVLSVVLEKGDEFNDAVAELCSFFERHLNTGLLPFSSAIEYPSSAQRQVYTFLDSSYRKFVEFMNSYDGALTNETAACVARVLAADRDKLLAPLAAGCFIKHGIYVDDEGVLGIGQVQESVYERLCAGLAEFREVAMAVLTREFPGSSESHSFTRLVESFTRLELSDSELRTLMDGFDAVLARLDDKLIVYDFLYKNFVGESVVAFMCLPYLVEVSTTRAVDVENVYSHAFKALTIESVVSPKRVKFLDTLSRILNSPKLPVAVPTAFAVKLSRYLPLIPVDCQLDVLSLIHTLVRAHESVAKLLVPIDAPVSNVAGDIDECKPQTLWEALALRSSAIPVIADTANKLGHFHLPPGYGSFDLKAALDSCKSKPKVPSDRTGNWLSGLDRTVWTFH